MDVHLFGPAALIRAVLPHMRRQRSGAIVQMSSVGGRLSFAGFSAYSATKFALEGLSEALALEVGPLRLPLGSDAVDAILARLDGARRELLAWQDVSRGTDFEPVKEERGSGSTPRPAAV